MFAARVKRAQEDTFTPITGYTSLSKHFTLLKVMAKAFQKLIIVEIQYYGHMFELSKLDHSYCVFNSVVSDVSQKWAKEEV